MLRFISTQSRISLYSCAFCSLKHILVMNLLVIGVCLVFASLYPNIGTIIRYVNCLRQLYGAWSKTFSTDAIFWTHLFTLISKFASFKMHSICIYTVWNTSCGSCPISLAMALWMMLCLQTAYLSTWILVLGRESSHMGLGLVSKGDGLALWSLF